MVYTTFPMRNLNWSQMPNGSVNMSSVLVRVRSESRLIFNPHPSMTLCGTTATCVPESITARIGLLSSVCRTVRIGPDAFRATTSEGMLGLGTDDAIAFMSSRGLEAVGLAGSVAEILLNEAVDVDA